MLEWAIIVYECVVECLLLTALIAVILFVTSMVIDLTKKIVGCLLNKFYYFDSED